MINWLIEAVYDFYKDPKNLAEFEGWKKSKRKKEENEHLCRIQQVGEFTHRNN